MKIHRFIFLLACLYIQSVTILSLGNELLWKNPKNPIEATNALYINYDENGEKLVARDGSKFAILIVYVKGVNKLNELNLQCSYNNSQGKADMRKNDLDNDGFYYKFYLQATNYITDITLYSEELGIMATSPKSKLPLKEGITYVTHVEVIRNDIVTFVIHTSPNRCHITYNGRDKWETDAYGNITKVIRNPGDYNDLRIEAEGYITQHRKVYLDDIRKNKKQKGNDTVRLDIKLGQDIDIPIEVPAFTKIYLKDSSTNRKDSLIYDNSSGSFGVKYNAKVKDDGNYTYRVERKGYKILEKTVSVRYGRAEPLTFKSDDWDVLIGVLKFSTRPSGADVYIDDEKQSYSKDGIEVPIGTHTITLKKARYAPLSKSVTIKEEDALKGTPTQLGDLYLSKTNNEWWSSSQFFPHHYLETYYGMGITADKKINNYIGVNYTFIRHALGLNISAMYGFNNQDIVATAGPALTLTQQSKTDLDLQLLLGAGYASVLHEKGASRTGTWVAEAGLRFGFESAITDYPFALWSIFMGAKYYDKKIVPTIGISLIPIGLLALDYCKEETDFSHVFLDPMVGYAVKSKDVMVGGHFAWQKYNVGFYTSFMYGVFHKNISAVVGPAWHITPYADIFDLSLYGGIGYGRKSDQTNHLAGDLGLRFGFGDDVFNWYNFSLGCTTFGGEWIPNFGLSLMPVKGLVELAILDEDDFPAHYTEAMAAYCFGNREWMLGTNYSWIQTHLGLYASFLIGLRGSSATVNAGPVIRLTPDDYVVDLQLYQGMGWSKFGDNSAIGGETGIRMGFRTGHRFGLFSLNTGVNYSKDDIAISFGISWVLAGTVASCGTAAFFY